MNDGKGATWQKAIPRFNVAYTPFNYLEIGLAQGYYYTYPDLAHLGSNPQDSIAMHGMYDTELRAKFSYSKMLWPITINAALMPEIILPMLRSQAIPDSMATARDLGFGLHGLFSIKSEYFDVLLNAGYSSKTDYMPIKIGVQPKIFFFKPFVEVLLFGDKQYFTPGIMVDVFGFKLFYSQDLALSEAAKLSTPGGGRYTGDASIGFGYSTPEKWVKPERTPVTLTIKVKDDRGNLLKNASIVIKDTKLNEDVKSVKTQTNGIASLNIFPGTYRGLASLKGYSTISKDFTVKDKKDLELTYTLKLLPVEVVFVVKDEKTKKPLPGVNVKIAGKEARSDNNGYVRFELYPDEYAVDLTKEGYIGKNSKVKVVAGEKKELSITLVKKGMKLSFDNILFETGSSKLLPESYPIIDQVARILKENPNISMEIAGHTDSRGSARSNQILSENRAKSVKQYLVEKRGIDPTRLLTKGYGESKPVATNATKEGRQKNRRVEFKVLNER